MTAFNVRYDRRVSETFLSHFLEDGVAAYLPRVAAHARYPVDFQLRKDVKSGAEHATLYVGLTAVLNVRTGRAGTLALSTHSTHVKTGRFDLAWGKPRTPEQLAKIWGDVESYVERIVPLATLSHGHKEGAVQAAFSSQPGSTLAVLDREVTPAFRDTPLKEQVLAECERPILQVLDDDRLAFSGRPKGLGSECDALAVDSTGRLLAVEVKPLAGGRIPWAPAQALMYARVLQKWVDEDSSAEGPTKVLRGMLQQRRALGLAPAIELGGGPLRLTPVVALQRGASAEAVRRMRTVRDVLAEHDFGVSPLEIYEVTLTGELVPLREGRETDGRPRPTGAYTVAMNQRAAHWKAATHTLPDEARRPGQVRNRQRESVEVEYALPQAYAEHNLLPEVRTEALSLFAELGIPWHQGGKNSPSPHLRSSQVQCVNALGQMVSDSKRIKRAFTTVLGDMDSVRDFGEIDPDEQGRYLTFEYIGPKDYFGEGRRGHRTRGSQCTSVDAAFAYRTTSGKDALALVEWKFTESYPSAVAGWERKVVERTRRYGSAIHAANGPIDAAGVDVAALFHEPIYQLVRQQLLAHALAEDPGVRAEIVRVVHVLSPLNTAYQRSYISPELRERGDSVDEVWRSLLRPREAFVKMDPADFLDPSITSEEYCSRYGAGGE
jgi:hypothetical protein